MSEATSGEKGKNDETTNSFTSKAKMNLNRYLKNTRNSRKRDNANGEAATNSKRSSSYNLNRSLPDYFDDFQDGEFKELSIEISTGNLPSGRNTNNGEISVVRKPRSSSSNLESSRAYKTTEIQLTPTLKRKPEAVYNGKEYELKKQIFFLQEELIRSKLLLDQSQTMRKLELEKFQELEDRSNFIDGRMNSRSDIDKQMDLINQVTRLQASETMLKNSIENERLKVNRLNHQIFELNQKLYEAGVDPHTPPSMNDSLEGADFAKQLHIKIETSSQSSGSSSDNYPIVGPTARAKNDSGVNSQSELGFNDANVADYPSLFKPPKRNKPDNKSRESSSKNEAQYYEILEKLRTEDEGLAIENPTYHDIVVHLYKQKQNAIKNLDEFSFYMKQMNIPRGGENKNPVESIKKVYFQMKANEDQINYLKEKVDSYKLEIEMQQIEYSTQLKSIWEENELLKERLRDHEQQLKQQQRQQRLVVAASNTEYSHELDTAAAWQTASKSTSTTIPSHETTSKTYAIVSEEVSSVNKPLITYMNRHSSPLPMAKTHDRGMATDMTLFLNMGVQVDAALMLNSGVQCDLGATTTNYRGFDAVQNEPPPAERDLEAEILAEREKLREAFENEIQVMLGRIGDEIDKNKVNKPNIEGQLGEILTELKRYQSENLNLSGRYDQYLTGLNEQLNSIKAENVRTKSENSDLKLKQNLNNAELSNIIENYGEELKRLNAEMDKSKENFDALKIENERLVEKNRDLVNSNDRLKKEIQTKNSECQNRTSQLEEAYSQVELIRDEFESVKRINESLVNEKSVFKQKNQRQNEEMFKKLESYENEISQLRKQVKQLELDSKKLEIDYSLKCDEASRLQRSLSEIDELREKCITCEQKLDYQVKTNKTMQEKLYQLQLELVSKMPNQPQQIVTSATDASYESIIDDLKFIIHQQIAYRNPSPLADVEELKHKIHDLQLKLQHEKLQNERLEFKLKLVDQDNQQLKQALYSSSRKTTNSDKTGKTRMEEMMDMIAKAQQNAQNILATNPNITEDLKNQQHLFTQSAVN